MVRVDDAEIALAVVTAGAAVVQARAGTVLARVDKDGHDFATDADIESELAMIRVLREHRPRDAILGEETGPAGPADARRRWLLDPMCGTANVAAGTPLAGVNAALDEDGRLTAAAVADPFTGETFWTDGSRGWLRGPDADRALEPSAGSRMVELNLDPPQPNAPGFRTVDLAASAAFSASFEPRVLSTSLALVWVADGRRAAYVTDGEPRGSVHFSAGIAICRAAGCVVTGLRGEAELVAGSGLLCAADTETHAALLSMIAALGADRA